jgi:hypothetical protein
MGLVPISSKKEIQNAKPDTEEIAIRKDLPIQDYPLLAKFTRLSRIGIWARDGQNATDEKLKALAALSFTNLVDVNLLNGRLVTDEGIRSLSQLPVLKMLGLEGTSITDAGCEVMASKMRLTGVNVANCPGVGLKGIKTLGSSATVTNLSFSADNLTQKDVLDLIGSFKNIRWCQVVDTQGKIDGSALKAKGAERNIYVFVKSTGALQDMGLDR